jgi:alpha-N-arabinofuranosidase
VRNPEPKNFSLVARKGFLRIKAAKDALNSKEEVPAFVGQRQPAFRVRVVTSMDFAPLQDGEEAGLCVRANDDNHYEVGLGRFEGKTRIFVRTTVKGAARILALAPCALGSLQLEISATESQYRFAWSADGKTWNALGASAAADLSKERAGGFTGAVLGLYATATGKKSEAHADFGWFEMLQAMAD